MFLMVTILQLSGQMSYCTTILPQSLNKHINLHVVFAELCKECSSPFDSERFERTTQVKLNSSSWSLDVKSLAKTLNVMQQTAKLEK